MRNVESFMHDGLLDVVPTSCVSFEYVEFGVDVSCLFMCIACIMG